VVSSGDRDLAGRIWILGLLLFLSLLLWLELDGVEQAAARLNKPSGVCCFFFSAHPFPCYFPLSGRGGLGRWCGDSAVGGFGGGGGLAYSVCERGAGRRSASLSPPSSTLPACLGGKGKRG
jgi:hypothetical protein